jgi:hypothetical protein
VLRDAGGEGGPPLFFVLWGIPFVLVGLYFMVGRFFLRAWWKRNTHYAVTNKRVVALTSRPRRSLQSMRIDSIPAVTKIVRRDGVGTIYFSGVPGRSLQDFVRGRAFSGWAIPGADVVGPVFVDIAGVDAVDLLVGRLRDEGERERASPR